MKVLHLCLSCFFIDDRAYQENELVDEHLKQGHDVLVVASTQVHDDKGLRQYVKPGEYLTKGGVRVIRIPYAPYIPHALGKSLRIHQGVYSMIDKFEPDAILFHGICGWELLTVARYKKKNPRVLFFADTHTDFVNSGKSFLSKWVLHYCYYRFIVHFSLPQIDKILCISSLTKSFAKEFYKIPDKNLEFYPLGGRPLPQDEYTQRRKETRKQFGLSGEGILFVQSGKLDTKKKLLESLVAFEKNLDSKFKLVIVGVLKSDIIGEAEQLIDADSRVDFIGWKSPHELETLLCGADVYLQPGSQSSTMQTSLCCRCAVVLENWESHKIYVQDNGWLVDNSDDISEVLKDISENKVSLSHMRSTSGVLASEMLDYSVLAKRVLTLD